MKALNKQALRQLAEKATPGPWEMEHENIWFKDAEGYTKHLMYAYQGDDVDDQQDHDNSAYIAAFNPKVVLALLDELEAADRINAHYRTRLDRLERRCNHQGSVYWDASGVKRCAGCGIDATGIGVKGE
ncbi:ead/Ea22-like family protein [Salmonella enterica]|nr:ead/Ea22-like family protein [Salmonella enterica]MCH5835077.1 ead/Ea22-like family protein [Salmonella enterica]MCH5839665.1 ead/Ea22-like family protein [Salmonella enterica]MCH5858793.1 ead/Ea22-like family protein [Salmonella enterica]MCH5863823.1 ead/Ea22-like family protein [Salmonella enterica]